MLSLLLSSSPEARRSFAGVGNCLGRQRCSGALGTFHTGRDLSARVSICHETRVVIRRARGKTYVIWACSLTTWVRECTEVRDPSKRLVKRCFFGTLNGRGSRATARHPSAHGDMCVTGLRTWNKQVKSASGEIGSRTETKSKRFFACPVKNYWSHYLRVSTCMHLLTNTVRVDASANMCVCYELFVLYSEKKFSSSLTYSAHAHVFE